MLTTVPSAQEKQQQEREVSTMSAELHFPMAVFDYLYKCECPQFPSFSIAKCVLAWRMYVHRQGSSTCKNWQSRACTGGSSTPLASSYQNISLAHSTHQSMEWPVSQDSQKLCVYNGGLPSVQDVAYSPTPFWFVVVATFP
jgi:hypothetical protein